MKEVFSYEKLYKAYLDCRKNKRNTESALEFEWNLEENLYELHKEIRSKSYQPGKSNCFVCKEPTPREIFAAEFRDRVVHHLLVREIEDCGEKVFIHDSYSCRPGKGTHAAVERLSEFCRKVTNNYSQRAYCLQMDISGFFMNINHDILFAAFKKLVVKQKRSHDWKRGLLWLGRKIIYHKPTKNYQKKGDLSLFNMIPSRKSLFSTDKNKGLPIGNYSSQFFSNLYLNQLDQFVKRELERDYYIRYVDDFLILSNDKKSLKRDSKKIERFLDNFLDTTINKNKTKLRKVKEGVDFLGYFLKPHYKLARKRTVKALKGKLFEFRKSEEPDLKEILATVNSYFGHFRHADTLRLRKDIYKNNLGKLKQYFIPTNKKFFSLNLNQSN